ncbi:polysaccharide pyruvyl transferase CsaB [Paenibacillus dokdonensis]|uniref:Polysaccharide pyruvyl transferase CsaB n=1 Tax=Paenibacillus dokdonensis TaxID=2567944 RepID=A0ABU6GTW9_9BACL|nr:polysaccharide pyruvyl transferase CsaB [Paenibacillus dokdonensis]MEC0243195.1 polysaccharide pyruvyl transferase CsaB [Paenibacillus dokdonensis]
MVTSPQKTIVISGYYGFKNSGDEAVLSSILTALEEKGKQAGVQINPVVLSIDPEWTSSTYGVQSVHRMKLGEVRQALKNSSGLISGGGSLLQDATSPKTIPYYLGVIKLAQWMNKPVFIYSQGIGPVNRKLFNPLIKNAFKKCEYISVRDVQSAELLQSMGLQGSRIQVVPDPVMGLTPEPDNVAAIAPDADQQLPVIGVSVRYWDPKRRELQGIAEGLRAFCEKQPVHLRFLPFHFPGDEKASQEIIGQLGDIASGGSKVSVCREAVHPGQMLAEVGRCDLVIGMRLHSLIYAANRLVPLIGVSYDPKINHFLKRLDITPVGTSSSLDPGKLTAEISRLMTGAEAWKEAGKPLIDKLKQEAQAPAQHIIDFLK